MKKLSKEGVIWRLKKAHGDEYDYSKVEYVNARTKIKLFCKKHKIDFEITLDSAFNKGCGCPLCRYEKSSSKLRTPVDVFISKANEIHNGKYDYSKVEYKNNSTKVCIICPEHGEFWQTPAKHITRKHGCPVCGGSTKRTIESFIKDAKNVHDDKYDYSKAKYVNIHTPLLIVCPIHGEFYQAPNEHLRGQGCPHCRQSKIEKEVYNLLTENKIEFISQYKYDDENKKNSVDFYIPSINTAIECQGEQHFKPVDFANNGKEWANELFEKNILRDCEKSVKCKNKGIKLLYYIPKKNTVPGYKSDDKFNSIYSNDNVYNTINQLKKAISNDI